MKILGAGHYIAPHLGVIPELLIRFAMDQGIRVAIVGCASLAEVGCLAAIGRTEDPLTKKERDQLISTFTP